MDAKSTIANAADSRPVPIRTIGNDDVREALNEGYRDFLTKRGDLLFVGLLYPVVGLIAVTFITSGASLPLLFPLVAGLSLLGPLVSAGFYELARRRENGLDASWKHFFDVTRARNFSDLMFVGMILIAIFVAWMFTAFLLHNIFLGAMLPKNLSAFMSEIFTTPGGWAMIVLGNLAGAFFAILVLATSFVSMPMIVDRNVDAGLAMRTSMRAFKANRSACINWGARVAILLLIGSLPLFLGLAVVLPVLGYATWHLYTRMIDRSNLPPAQRRG